jgi:phage shock protein C
VVFTKWGKKSMKKLYRSRRHRVIGGVASGLAQYLDVDITITRLAIALMALIAPNVVLAYILAWIIIPEAPLSQTEPQVTVSQPRADATGAGPSIAGPGDGARQQAVRDLPPTADEIILNMEGREHPGQTSSTDEGVQQTVNTSPGTVPTPPVESDPPGPGKESYGTERDNNRQFFGYVLIAIGILVLLKKHVPSFWLNMPIRFIRTWWPAVIILAGLGLIFSALRRD